MQLEVGGDVFRGARRGGPKRVGIADPMNNRNEHSPSFYVNRVRLTAVGVRSGGSCACLDYAIGSFLARHDRTRVA